MNAGLSSLAVLKAALLPAGLVASTDYDAILLAVGKGVAGQMERHCNRLFQRVVDDVFECTADRAHVSLPRYPVESISEVALRETLTAGFVAQADAIENQSLAAGMVYFGAELGGWMDRLRITYTGGYWFPDAASDVGTGAVRDQGSIALSPGDESAAIAFAGTFLTAPNVTCVIVPPPGGSIITSAPSSITISGATAILGAPIPGWGYTLQWEASLLAADPIDDSAQPVGATLLPSELSLAFQLQCKHVWQQMDVLGLSVAEKPAAAPALKQLDLLPEVASILNSFRRYVIL